MFTFRETNLKVRQPLPDTHELQDNEDLLAKFDGNDCSHVNVVTNLIKVMLSVSLQTTDYTSL